MLWLVFLRPAGTEDTGFFTILDDNHHLWQNFVGTLPVFYSRDLAASVKTEAQSEIENKSESRGVGLVM